MNDYKKDPLVINNWLPSDLGKFINYKYLYYTPHYFNHTSNEKGDFYHNEKRKDVFYGSPLDPNNHLLEYLCTKIKNTFFVNRKMHLHNITLNIQHKGMDGDWHLDNCNTSILYFSNPSNDNGGQFEYLKDNGEIIKIPYKFNQLIIFNGHKKHRGMPFTDGLPRMSMAFKLDVD